MKIIYNKTIPFGKVSYSSYMGMTTFNLLWVKYNGKKPKLSDNFIRHEEIHKWQQIILFITALIIMLLIIIFMGISWWWMLATPIIPFIIYVLCWIIEILLPPYDQAYKNICFESEAQYNECNPNYLKNRKIFAEFKYISNRKYPYLTANQRKALWNNYLK